MTMSFFAFGKVQSGIRMIVGLLALLEIASQLHARTIDLRELDEHRLEQRVLEAAESNERGLEGYDFAFEAENEINDLRKEDSYSSPEAAYRDFKWIREAFQCLCPTNESIDLDGSRHIPIIPKALLKKLEIDREIHCREVTVAYQSVNITVAYIPKDSSALYRLFKTCYDENKKCKEQCTQQEFL
eukprot:Seg6431.1 transcript_id=Seg6431.1/GoldUCD/mRNA.D3Y31 product="hypothetical protein" protein_id=Seg6431.1/GoldUCD/D3Y31